MVTVVTNAVCAGFLCRFLIQQVKNQLLCRAFSLPSLNVNTRRDGERVAETRAGGGGGGGGDNSKATSGKRPARESRLRTQSAV